MGKRDTSSMVKEEQEIVNKLVDRLEKEIKNKDEKLLKQLNDFKKAKEMGADAYGMLVDARNKKNSLSVQKNKLSKAKDELYESRLIVECIDEDGTSEEIELKVGLKSYPVGSDVLIYDSKNEICQHFILFDDDEYDSVVIGKHGEKYRTKFKLKMKRKVDMRFAHVRNVTHLFPITNEEEAKLVYDEFLAELASRRDSKEFQNIIFSIQKKQGQIIKTPYRENMIVQGCAGSGKSMIMLHRLPILLVNNPKELGKNNLYIISPSETYIQMAENLREELEIKDLRMGTLNQYFDYVLEKYQVDSTIYEDRKSDIILSVEKESYVYSDEFINDIKKYMERYVSKYDFNYQMGLETYQLGIKTYMGNLPYEKINHYVLDGNKIIGKVRENLRKEFQQIRESILILTELVEMISSRKTAISRGILREISKAESEIEKAQKELEKDKTLGDLAIHNRVSIINSAKNRILRLQEDYSKLEQDVDYFKEFIELSVNIIEVLKIYEELKENFEEHSIEQIYEFISDKEFIALYFEDFKHNMSNYEERYLSYTDSVYTWILSKEKSILAIQKDYLCMDVKYYQEITEVTEYYTKLLKELPKNIYLELLSKLGIKIEDKKNVKYIINSPYIYAQIMYQFKGVPNADKEKLICIDEAQALAPNELRLINNINNKSVIFNLFGDEKQHIEDTKGIDSWKEFSDVINVKPKRLDENYRNAVQITRECNRRFDMCMRPINTEGNGVHIIEKENFKSAVGDILIHTQKAGTYAIIVDSKFEVLYFNQLFREYKGKLHNITEDEYGFHKTRWNILTVGQAKGLEFETVIAISGNMSKNKKYIAYTRARDELYIYDEEFDVPENLNESKELIFEEDLPKTKKKRSHVKKKEKNDYSQSELRKYLEDHGLQVKDLREGGGFLWVIGSKDELISYIDDVYEVFEVMGKYQSKGKPINYREGFYFKTDK